VSGAEDSLAEAEELLAELDQVRQRLDSTDDVDAVIEILGELNEITKKVEAAINEAKRRTEAEADAEP
jgi:predicted RND superfamily exporter protein